jgi:heterodisulfide reductase subunit A-like polyferredoxin
MPQGMGGGRGMGMGGGIHSVSPLNDPNGQPNVQGLVAKVDSAACTGCGRCIRVCNYGAISLIDARAYVDPARCTGCGQCVATCPNTAISMVSG